MTQKAVTTADIKLALRRLYAQPEWALLFEVGDATGARHTRFADALAMSLWPSRGLSLTGMEIKVSRSDWHRERAKPEKAETIAAFCDYWQLVTGPKVVLDESEIPPAWGWIEYNGERFVTRRSPTATDAKPITRQFLAALLRREHKADDAVIDAMVKTRMEFFESDFNVRVERAAERNAGKHAEKHADLSCQVHEFEGASGFKISEWSAWGSEAKELGRAAKAVRASGIDASFRNLHTLSRDLMHMSEKIDAAIAKIGLPRIEPVQADLAKGRRRA